MQLAELLLKRSRSRDNAPCLQQRRLKQLPSPLLRIYHCRLTTNIAYFHIQQHSRNTWQLQHSTSCTRRQHWRTTFHQRRTAGAEQISKTKYKLHQLIFTNHDGADLIQH
jgi:hypothetical protein